MAYNNRGFAYVKASIRSDMFKPGGAKIIVDFYSVEKSVGCVLHTIRDCFGLKASQ